MAVLSVFGPFRLYVLRGSATLLRQDLALSGPASRRVWLWLLGVLTAT